MNRKNRGFVFLGCLLLAWGVLETYWVTDLARNGVTVQGIVDYRTRSMILVDVPERTMDVPVRKPWWSLGAYRRGDQLGILYNPTKMYDMPFQRGRIDTLPAMWLTPLLFIALGLFCLGLARKMGDRARLYVKVSIILIFASACESESAGPDANLPPDTARGTGLLLPWSEITGRITYASPTQLILIDGVRREVRTIRDAASNELFVDLASSSHNSEVAVVSLLPDGSHRTTVIGMDSVVKRTVERAYCARWLRDGRLSFLRGDTLYVENAVMTVLNPQPWSCPSWSADGTHLLISLRDTVRRSQVYRIRTTNTVPERLTLTAVGGPLTSWDDPSISPAGQTFALAYSSDDPINEVMLANTGGGIIRKLAEGTRLYGFSWAPDGSQVLALSTVSSAGGLFLIRASDGAIRKLVNHPVYAAAWGP